MPGRFDLEPCAAACRGTERDQQLGKDRDRVSFCLWGDRVHDLAHQPVIDGRIRLRWPAVGNRQGQRAARLRVVVWWLIEQRQRRHSVETSATAARAELSSTIAFFAANAAISEATARLLT